MTGAADRKEPSETNANKKDLMQVLAATIAFLLVCLPLFSQGNQGTIQGGVFDQTGGAVVGATVSVIDVARGITRALTTDSAGEYVATNLTPGTYTVRAEAKGFRSVEHAGVLVEVGQNIRVDLVVQPGEQTQTITVTSEIPAIDTTDSTLGGTVSNESINALPLNGRNFQRLIQLRPGQVSQVGSGSAFSVTNGRRTQSDMTRVEGIAGIGHSASAGILNTSYRGGDTNSLIPIDAIQEFSAEQNPKAENGFRDGGVVNVGIKSGTNGVHGTAYAFGRDAQATDAGNFFRTPTVDPVTPATLEQFGATAGGPILKDKLFWFAGYEGLRLLVGDVAVDSIPSDIPGPGPALSMVDACLALNPTHAPLGNPANLINPLSAQLAGLNTVTCSVAPASATFENVFPYNPATSTSFSPGLPTTGPLNNGLFKGDYVIGPHHHVSGMFFTSESTQTVNSATGQLLPQWEVSVVNNVRQYSGDWTWTPSSTWVNDFRTGLVYNHSWTYVSDANLLPSNPWPNGYGMNTGVTNPFYGGFPQITFNDFTGYLGSGNRSSVRGPEGDLDLVETVSHLRGKHAFKFGFEFIDIIFDGNSFSQAQGMAKFGSGAISSLSAFLQGIAARGTILLGDPTQNSRSHWYGGFFQDDWRVSPRITLNLGLRYEYIAPPFERSNYLGNFDPNVNPATTPALEQVSPGEPITSLYHAYRANFSPRFGTAWDVKGDGKTVVRAGFGVLRNPSIMGSLVIANPFGANFPSLTPPVNTSGTDINLHTPDQISLNGCGVAACGPGGFNWTLQGPVFPSSQSQVINNATYTGVTCTANPAVCGVGAVDPNFRDPYSLQWNLDIQRAITSKLALDVAYIGNHGAQEQALVDLNQPPIGAGWAGATAATCINSAPLYSKCKVNASAEVGQYSATFPYFNYITETTNGDVSNYDGLQVTLQARDYHGLSFLSGYTYSHALNMRDGNVSSNALVEYLGNFQVGYGNGGYDLRHRFTFAPTYAIPGKKSPGQMLEGWTVSSIVVLQTGMPWFPNDSSSVDWLGTGELGDNSGDAQGTTQFWNYTGPRSAFNINGPYPIPCFGKMSGCTPYPVVGGVPQLPSECAAAAVAPYAGNAQLQSLALAALTNLGCWEENGGILTPPAYGTIGNAGKGIFRGPNYRNVDLSVSKIWKFKERYSAQFRAEFFNLLNRADFAIPGNTNPTAAFGTFGTSTTTPDSSNPVLGSGGPRHIQFGLKLVY